MKKDSSLNCRCASSCAGFVAMVVQAGAVNGEEEEDQVTPLELRLAPPRTGPPVSSRAG